MVKVITTLILTFATNVLFSQSSFDKFDGPEEITTVIVNKKMFEMMSKVKVNPNDKEAIQYMELVKKLDNLKVFITSNTKYTSDMKTTVDKYLKTASLEELMRISEGGKSVKIHVKSGATETRVKELLMFIEGGPKDKETVLMILTGDFDLNDISILTEKMNLPGGEDLKKASKLKK